MAILYYSLFFLATRGKTNHFHLLVNKGKQKYLQQPFLLFLNNSFNWYMMNIGQHFIEFDMKMNAMGHINIIVCSNMQIWSAQFPLYTRVIKCCIDHIIAFMTPMQMWNNEEVFGLYCIWAILNIYQWTTFNTFNLGYFDRIYIFFTSKLARQRAACQGDSGGLCSFQDREIKKFFFQDLL